MIEQEKIFDVIDRIVSGYDPEKIILFGSYAVGNPNVNSDLDLFVIKESELPRPQRTMQVRRMLYGVMIPIDLVVYTPQEIEQSKDNTYSFVFEVLKTGKVLYERTRK